MRTALLLLLLSSLPARAATYAADTGRTGWYPDQPTLTGDLLSSGAFGRLWKTAVVGQVYAQPLVSRGVLFVATEGNWIYGLDPRTGAPIWSRSLGVPFDPNQIRAGWACPDIAPSIGVTGTPVIDEATGIAYFVSSTSAPATFMHAVDVTTGNEQPHFPVAIQGFAQNAPGVAFDPRMQLQRPALLLSNGVVYAGFSGHCDFTPFHGFLAGVSTDGRLQSLWTDVASGASGAGIWMSGGGPVSDRDGSMIIATGNSFGGGSPVGSIPGNLVPGDLGESVVRLDARPDGTLRGVDFFTPSNANVLDNIDADLGAAGPVLLPPAQFGTPATPHLLVQGSKQGYLYLLDADHLGGASMGTAPGQPDAILARVGPLGLSIFGRTGAVWPGEGGWIYLRTSGPLIYLSYGVGGDGLPSLQVAANSAASNDYFSFAAGEPVVTSNGTQAGSALVWVIWMAQADGLNAQLRAYDPLPVAGVPHLRWSTPIGIGSKFSLPGVSGGRIFVGTRDSHVLGFGAPLGAALSGEALVFPATPLGSSSTMTETVTAGLPVTINSIAASNAQFAIGAPSRALPVALAAGDVLTVPVTFTPAQAATSSATLTLASNFGDVEEGLSGTGLINGPRLMVAPPAVDFGSAASGTQLSVTVTFSNIGSASLTLGAPTLPSPPFAATGVPSAGTTLQPGASATVTLTFSPPEPGSYRDHLVVSSTGGDVDLPLVAAATAPGRLDIAPLALDFGDVEVGSQKTLSFTVTNGGGTALTITRSKELSAGAYVARAALDEGSSLLPGQTVRLPIEFAPISAGPQAGAWSLNSNAPGSGAQTVAFSATGHLVGFFAAPDPLAGGWQLNGSAAQAGPLLELTPALPTQTGSAFWPVAMPSQGLDVTFVATLDSGTGGQGLALVLADPEKGALPTALGGGLGFDGIPAVAVVLGTAPSLGNPGGNFVAINEGGDWVASTTGIPDLRDEAHVIRVTSVGGTLVVSVDGAAVLAQQVALPGQLLIGFSAATGAAAMDRQAISEVRVKSGQRLPSPSLSLSPAGGAVAGRTLVRALASGPVASLRLSLDGAEVARGAASEVDFAWDTTPVPNGPHRFDVQATDQGGLFATATANLQVFNPPVVLLDAPARAAGTVTLTASASPPLGTTISTLSISVDGVTLATGPSPLSASWNASALPSGAQHSVVARAVDADGSAASAQALSVVANLPTAQVDSPAEGASVAGEVTVSWTAAAPAGTALASTVAVIDGVALDGAVWHTASSANGDHSVAVKVTDADGSWALSPAVHVRVKNVPAASLIAPASASGTVTLIASGTAPAGTSLVALAILVDGAQAAAAAVSPLVFAWSTAALENGHHLLTVTATDADGASVTADPLGIDVENGATLWLAPAVRSLVAGGVGQTLAVTAAFTGSAAPVALSVRGLPAGVSAVFEPPVLAAGSTSILLLTATAAALPGSTTFTVIGASALGSAQAQGALTVTAPSAVLLENLGRDPITFEVTLRATTSADVQRIALYDGSALVGEGLASPLVAVWDTRAARNGVHTLLAVATSPEGDTSNAALEVVVKNDFSLALRPQTIPAGAAQVAIDTAGIGAAEAITLSAEGATFAPNPVMAGKSAVMSLAAAAPGALVVTGKTWSVPEGRTATLAVEAPPASTSKGAGCASAGSSVGGLLGLLALFRRRRIFP
jgi:outer membrane protein assembly factor BamB